MALSLPIGCPRLVEAQSDLRPLLSLQMKVWSGLSAAPPIPRSSTFWTVLGIWGFFFFFFKAHGVLLFALIVPWQRDMHHGHVSYFVWFTGLVSGENIFNFPALSKANLFNSFPFNSLFFTFFWSLILAFDFFDVTTHFALCLPSFHFYA